MRQIMLPPGYSGGKTHEFRDKDFHYLHHVLRLKKGNIFRGIDLKGNLYSLTVVECLKDRLTAECRFERKVARPAPFLSLCQCLPKGKKMDTIVRQATEAGVSEIIPVISEFTVPVYESGRDARSKNDRWQRIVREAVQQSGNVFIPEVREPVPLTELTREPAGRGISLFFHNEKLKGESLHEYLSDVPSSISFLIGAEGGLSGREIDFLLEKEFKPVYLGQNVLRTETAALFALASIKIILFERHDWRLH
ncbi:MAG: 16S rRNA (uracil(1498)-N(3))-methyltransferase [Spirochaetales bacterium]|nr:16S rRNA (uracil(1498)-N(3))-methyltransferase [Spirochaetales bacterium]